MIINRKSIKMKKLLLPLILFPLLGISQYATADFIVLNEGSEEDYHKLEKVWRVYHQKSIDAGEKSGWAVWKRTPKDDDGELAADYVVFNQFTSEEQMENWMNNFDLKKAISEMKNGLKGKMSSRAINKIIENGPNIKKQVRIYTIEMLDATPWSKDIIKIGDKMTFAPMIQTTEDYEQVESNIYKPHILKQVENGKHKWWGFTKVIDRNENAYEQISHITWNIPVEGAKFSDYFVENDFITKVLSDKVGSSRQMMNSQELTLVYQND